jgi:hypothetical protein
MGVGAAQPAIDNNGRFAVEIRSADGLGPLNATTPEYVPIPDASNYVTSSLFYGSSLRRLTNAPTGTDQPSALRLEYKVEGDTVFITATVFHGDFDQQNTPRAVSS